MPVDRFVRDDSGVSPVISTILMVAVAVIVAAVLATFALTFVEDTGDTAPQASFNYEYDNSTGNLTVTYTTGNNLDADQVRFAGAVIPTQDHKKTFGKTGFSGTEANSADGELNAGDSVTVDVNRGETVEIIWRNKENERTFVLSEYDVPDQGPAPSISGSFNISVGGVDGSVSGSVTVPTIDNTQNNQGYLVIDNGGSDVKSTTVSSGGSVSFTTMLDSTQPETLTATLYESSNKNTVLSSGTYTPKWASVTDILVIRNTKGCNDYVEYDLDFGGNGLNKVYVQWDGSTTIRNEHTGPVNDFVDQSISNNPTTDLTVATDKSGSTDVSGTILQTLSVSAQSTPCPP